MITINDIYTKVLTLSQNEPRFHMIELANKDYQKYRLSSMNIFDRRTGENIIITIKSSMPWDVNYTEKINIVYGVSKSCENPLDIKIKGSYRIKITRSSANSIEKSKYYKPQKTKDGWKWKRVKDISINEITALNDSVMRLLELD